jgi:RNA polymerase-binding transcription factor DksA
MTAASRFLKNAHGAAHDLARAERESKADADTVTYTRAELERARKAMAERVAALAADLERTNGLVCSECGRSIRIAIARGDR